MADIDVTVGMKTGEADRDLRTFSRKTAAEATNIRKTLDLALWSKVGKESINFLASSMREFAKESDVARKQLQGIGDAWAQIKGEVGKGLSELLDLSGVKLDAKTVRETAGEARAETMVLATDPMRYIRIKLAQLGATQASWMGWDDQAQRYDRYAAKQLDESDAYKGGMEEVRRREKEIRDNLQRSLNGARYDIEDQASAVGADEWMRKKIAAEADYRHALEQTAQLKKENSEIDTTLLENELKLLRDRTVEEIEWQRRVSQRGERNDLVGDAQAWQRRTNEARRDYRDARRHDAEDRRLQIDRLKQGETLELAQREARLRAEREIEELKKEKVFDDPAVQKGFIDQRKKDLADELDAIKVDWARHHENKFAVAVGSYGLGTLGQQIGQASAASGEASQVPKQQLEVLKNIEKNTKEAAGAGGWQRPAVWAE